MDSISKKLFFKTLILGSYRLIENIISYLIILIISYKLGPEGLGEYSFIFAFTTTFFIVTDFGLNSLLIKDLSENKVNIRKIISNIYSFKFSFSIIIYSLFIITILINKITPIIALLFAGAIEIFKTIKGTSNSILRSKLESQKIIIVDASERILTLLFSIYFYFYLNNLDILIGFMLISNLISTALNLIFSKKYYLFKYSLDFKLLKKYLKKGIPFIAITIFSTIYIQIDTIMLNFFENSLIVGYYSAGYKLINIFNFLPVVLFTFGFPIFSKLIYENQKTRIKKILESYLNYSLILFLPFVIIVLNYSFRIIQLIYNFDSMLSSETFKILIIAQIFIMISTILGNTILASKFESKFMKISAIGALVNIILNLILIPNYSLYGAGIATLITYIIISFYLFYIINKNIIKISIKNIINILIFYLINFVIIIYLNNFNFYYTTSIYLIMYFIIFIIYHVLKLNLYKKKFWRIN